MPTRAVVFREPEYKLKTIPKSGVTCEYFVIDWKIEKNPRQAAWIIYIPKPILF